MLRSRTLMWFSIGLLPPLGLVLVWMRSDWSVLRRVSGTLLVVVVALVELFEVYGLRVEWNGAMSEHHLRFEHRGRHYTELEESRARQREEAPAPTPVSAPANEAVPAKAPTATPVKTVPVSYWTDFRGPHRDGVYSQSEITTNWPSTGLPLVWKQPIGGGYASFTTGEGRAYTIEQRRAKEAVTAYDIDTGRELWAFSYPADFEEVLGGPGPRATPVYHDGFVYSLGANGDLYCLSAKTGKPQWSKNVLEDNGTSNQHWAMAGSPLIVDDKVIVTPGGTNGRSMVAYNRLTGEPVWRSLNDRAGYTSPILATLAGKRQIVWLSAQRALAVAVEDGKQLWDFAYPASMDMNCAQPVVVDESNVLFSSSDAGGAVLLEISRNGDEYSARPVWKTNRLKNKFNSSVLYQGYVYGFDEAILACMDAKTGELKWKGGRYGYGQLLLAGGYLVITTEQGDVVLVRATPEGHQELARFTAIEGRTWNIPAIDHGLLLVRNATEMACFRIGRDSR
ncbi:MAG TPA: PQQ-binding-like beta-propeller repeat protein [Bryobacteraceae bacterium]|nr:PQQ-binding-like beta-propeller repeat protein [Bryobacteraceae bacterium]